MSKAGKLSYEKFLGSPEWERIRRIVVFRDGAMCRECCARSSERNPLEVHHDKYPHEWGTEMEGERIPGKSLPPFLVNLRTLCRRCHKAWHKKNEPAREMPGEYQARIAGKLKAA